MIKQQIITMLEMQDAMNSKVHKDWRSQGNEWYRAIWVECAELMDHYGWKWWKKQEVDKEQVTLELIDIWHFGVSILLSTGASFEAIAKEIEEKLLILPTKLQDFRDEVETFACYTLQNRGFDLVGFTRLMAASDMSFEALYASYIGKNVLNFFRQDHGYKDGTYQKLWAGKEDNQHLVEVVEKLDPQRADLQEAIYAELKLRYPVN